MEYRINLTDDTVQKLGEVLGEPIQELEQEILDKEEIIKEQAETLEEQGEQIDELEDTIAEKQAIIDAFPTIEQLNVTQNGTYNEEGKAYKPVVVNVPAFSPATLNDFKISLVNNMANIAPFIVGCFGYNTGTNKPKGLSGNVPANSSLLSPHAENLEISVPRAIPCVAIKFQNNVVISELETGVTAVAYRNNDGGFALVMFSVPSDYAGAAKIGTITVS